MCHLRGRPEACSARESHAIPACRCYVLGQGGGGGGGRNSGRGIFSVRVVFCWDEGNKGFGVTVLWRLVKHSLTPVVLNEALRTSALDLGGNAAEHRAQTQSHTKLSPDPCSPET